MSTKSRRARLKSSGPEMTFAATFAAIFALVCAAVLATAGNEARAQAKAPEKAAPVPPAVDLIMSTVSLGINSAPFLLALEKGVFRRYGVNLKMVELDPASSVAALISGSTHITSAGPNIIDAALKAPDRVKVISTYGQLPMWLYTKSGLSLDALKGKTLASTTPGGLVDLAMKTMIMSQNLVPQRDVKILYTGNNAAVIAAIATGKVDGGVSTPPGNFQADDMGYRNVVYLNSLDRVKGKFGVIGVNQQYAQKYPHAVEAFVKAYLEGSRAIAGDVEGAKAAVLKHSRIANDKAFAMTFDLYLKNSLWPRDMHLPESEVAFLLKELEATNPAAKNAKPSDVLDNRYADAAK
jgi:ABC-type nitrate/sulfonate/bicarbonate transport system substrate-binding protein